MRVNRVCSCPPPFESGLSHTSIYPLIAEPDPDLRQL